MASRRATITTMATLTSLGVLAGIAMETNHGFPASTLASAPGKEIVTGTSGASSAAATIATGNERAPIVTRASGGGQIAAAIDD